MEGESLWISILAYSYPLLFIPLSFSSVEKKKYKKSLVRAQCLINVSYKYHHWDFPGGSVVKNPPANAGVHGFEPCSGKIPHAMEQLSLCATTTEPAL